ncbi:MAG: hypothetical protein LUQ34_03550 [Euryarchaeota archaeon]|nr:hypothetical protein [Euryarchaeota archaeon]
MSEQADTLRPCKLIPAKSRRKTAILKSTPMMVLEAADNTDILKLAIPE